MKQRKDKGHSPAGSPDHHPGKSEDQSSRGDLKHNQGPSADQGSAEVSNSASIGHFRTVDEAIVDLPIISIQNYQIIPDYRNQTNSKFPIVVQSEASCHCIDGWNLIEGAKSARQSVICCHVFHIENDSETEIAIRKAAIRTMPLGGTCSYAERVRNAGILFNMLWASSENPVVFSHGGARRGDNYTNCRGNNIHLVLAERLGKSVTTINKYLNHGEFLSEAALQTLIDAGAKKGFFEAIQKDKQQLIDDLKFKQKSHDEIVNAVSARVLSWLEETQTTHSVEIASTQSDQHEPPASEIQPQQNVVPSPPEKPIEHKHWIGNPSEALKKQLSENEICQEFINVGQLLIETAENKELSTQGRLQIFSSQIFRQSRLIQQLNHLMTQQSINPEEQR